MNKKLLPRLETDRLILREITEKDYRSYENNFIDYEVIKNLASGVPWPYPKGGVKDYFENVINPVLGITRWTWGICLKSNLDEIIGVVDLWRDGHPEHRGFWLAKKYWNQGIMTEACEPVTEFAFNNLKFEKLIFANAIGNIKSRRIKEKAGAVWLRKEKASFVNPKYKEHEIWELTKADWQKSKERL